MPSSSTVPGWTPQRIRVEVEAGWWPLTCSLLTSKRLLAGSGWKACKGFRWLNRYGTQSRAHRGSTPSVVGVEASNARQQALEAWLTISTTPRVTSNSMASMRSQRHALRLGRTFVGHCNSLTPSEGRGTGSDGREYARGTRRRTGVTRARQADAGQRPRRTPSGTRRVMANRAAATRRRGQ